MSGRNDNDDSNAGLHRPRRPTTDELLPLPNQYKRSVLEVVEAYKKETGVHYISGFERLVIEKRFAEGLVEGLKESLEMVLGIKFGEAGKRLIGDLRQINDIRWLRRVMASIESAAKLEEVRRVCRGSPAPTTQK